MSANPYAVAMSRSENEHGFVGVITINSDLVVPARPGESEQDHRARVAAAGAWETCLTRCLLDGYDPGSRLPDNPYLDLATEPFVAKYPERSEPLLG